LNRGHYFSVRFYGLLRSATLLLATAGFGGISLAAQTSAPSTATAAVNPASNNRSKVAVVPVGGETKIHGSTLKSAGPGSEEPLGTAARRLRKHKKHYRKAHRKPAHRRSQGLSSPF